jgi:hypothetical protein
MNYQDLTNIQKQKIGKHVTIHMAYPVHFIIEHNIRGHELEPVHGAVPRRLLSVKTARPKLLSANATVTKCKMDWNTVSTARTFWNFSLY